jgi:hypothetical protein
MPSISPNIPSNQPIKPNKFQEKLEQEAKDLKAETKAAKAKPLAEVSKESPKSPVQSDNTSTVWASRFSPEAAALTQEQQANLAKFLELKRSPNPADREAVLTQFNAESVGLQSWLIGLLGMVYDHVNTDPNFLQSLISNLLSYSKQGDTYILFSVLRSLSDRFDELPPSLLIEIRDFIQTEKLLFDTHPPIKQAAETLTQLLASKGVVSGQASITEAEPLLALPPQAKFVLMQLAQRALTTFVEEKNFDNLSLLYASLLNIENMALSIEDDIRPEFYEEIGFITDSLACVPSSLLKMRAIHVASDETGPLVDSYIEKIKYLLSHGYKKCVILASSRDHSPAYDAAKEAVLSLQKPSVKVLDTRIIGPGLGIVIDELVDALYQSGVSRKNAPFIIQNTIEKLHYWVIPQLAVVSRQPWFKRLPKRSPLRNGHHPLLALYEEPYVLYSLKWVEEGATILVQKALEALSSTEKNYRRVYIDYKTHYQVALAVFKAIQAKHPKLDIVLRQSPDTIVQLFGEHLSVALI